MAAVEHQHGRAGALILALHDHQIFVRDVMRRRWCWSGAAPDVPQPSRASSLHGVQQRACRIEIQRVAELVRLRRTRRFDTSRLLARVVPAVAALAERSEQVAQRAITEEVQRLVRDLELGDLRRISDLRRRDLAGVRARPRDRWRRDVALLRHAIDDLLDQFLQLRSRLGLVGHRPLSAGHRQGSPGDPVE